MGWPPLVVLATDDVVDDGQGAQAVKQSTGFHNGEEGVHRDAEGRKVCGYGEGVEWLTQPCISSEGCFEGICLGSHGSFRDESGRDGQKWRCEINQV